MRHTGRLLAVVLVLAFVATSTVLVGPLQTPVAYAQGDAPHNSHPAAPDIVNLSHLEFLRDTVPYPTNPPAGHQTVDPGTPIDAWWTYANYNASTNTYQRVGGGNYDAATNTWGQGAYNLDDVARVAVTYLEHYRYYGDQLSLERGYEALRFVLYMQTISGPNAGNFVLWMQPDGTLNPTPTPPDSPNPADAGFSWWAARATWAMAEGYDTFKGSRPDFAKVLADRLSLAMNALDQEVLKPNYGHYKDLHGYRVPAWFIGDGADASSVALLGLTRYYEDSHNAMAKRLANELAQGIQEFQLGNPVTWAFQAHLPWAGSLSEWHAWGVRMDQALSVAGRVFGVPAWTQSAAREANTFLTHELVSIGPINAMLPAPVDYTEINYGNDVLTEGLVELARTTHDPAYSLLAGLQATWWFGNNPAHTPMYDPATGRPKDAINNDGTVNMNAGAESTVSALMGLMSVLHDPTAARYVEYGQIVDNVGWQKFEAEAGTVSGNASVEHPASAWTGEAQWSGGAYVRLAPGGKLTLPITATVTGQYRLFIVYDKQQGPRSSVSVDVSLDGGRAVRHDEAGAAPPGDSPNPSYLWMDSIVLPAQAKAGQHTLTFTGIQGEARIDCVLLQPMVEYRVLSNSSGSRVALAKSFAGRAMPARIPLVGKTAMVRVFTQQGQQVWAHPLPVANGNIMFVLPAYGYAVIESQ
jgi:hypothetical protein